jgi:hypothetical protein
MQPLSPRGAGGFGEPIVTICAYIHKALRPQTAFNIVVSKLLLIHSMERRYSFTKLLAKQYNVPWRPNWCLLNSFDGITISMQQIMDMDSPRYSYDVAL